MYAVDLHISIKFQSTAPAGGATPALHIRPLKLIYFNPLRPRGARPGTQPPSRKPLQFQSTAPAGGATGKEARFFAPAAYFNPLRPRGARPFGTVNVLHLFGFQSTAPAGGATVDKMYDIIKQCISIHCARGGRDSTVAPVPIVLTGISIHCARGGRDLGHLTHSPESRRFQSTAPAGGAT